MPYKARRYWGTTPSLSLDFASALDPRITFTRASTGTYVDAAGVVQTASTNVPRIQYANGVCQGLLVEEARTNLALRSQQFNSVSYSLVGTATIADNQVTSKDGTVNAAKLGIVASGDAIRQQISSVTAGSTYSISLWMKSSASGGASNVRLTTNNTSAWNTGISQKFALTSSWQRFTLTGVAISSGTAAYMLVGSIDATGAGDATCTGNVDIWQAQFELGATASSDIPTTSAAVTRSADVASMPVGSWFNSQQGTWVASVQRIAGNAYPSYIVGYTDASQSTPLALVDAGGGQFKLQTYNGSVALNVSAGFVVDGAAVGLALTYSASGRSQVMAGAAVASDTGVFPATTTVNIGKANSSAWFNGTIRSIRYYPRRLSDTMLQALTR